VCASPKPPFQVLVRFDHTVRDNVRGSRTNDRRQWFPTLSIIRSQKLKVLSKILTASHSICHPNPHESPCNGLCTVQALQSILLNVDKKGRATDTGPSIRAHVRIEPNDINLESRSSPASLHCKIRHQYSLDSAFQCPFHFEHIFQQKCTRQKE
jgi:hypothetical protein